MTSSKPYAWSQSRIRISPFTSLQQAKDAERRYTLAERKQTGTGQQTIGFSYTSSLKSMGRIPRSHGLYELGLKYK